MHKERLVEDLCAQYCSFYKPDKDEELACNGFLIIRRLAEEGLEVPARPEKTVMEEKTAEELFGLVCPCCPFFEEDCDFASWRRGEKTEMLREEIHPCGGFLCLGHCIEHGTMDIRAIDRVI